MSAVWVRVDEAARGSLPARCARTGTRCITRYPRRPSRLPAAVEWVTWTDLWPRDGAAGSAVVPLLPHRHQLDQVLRRTRDVTAGLVPVALVLLLAGAGPAAGRLLGAALLVHAAVAVVGVLGTVSVRLDATGEWVRLTQVHRDFAEAAAAVTTRPESTPMLPEMLRSHAPGGRSAGGEAVGS